MKEVECNLKNVDKSSVSNCMSRKGIDVKWNFNVPVHPHGCEGWERAIRSVKYVLAAIIYNGMIGVTALKTRPSNDYALLTVPFLKIAHIMYFHNIIKNLFDSALVRLE